MTYIEPTETGPVEIEPRKHFNGKTRAEVFARAKGICHVCEGKIAVGQAWDLEHIKPLSMGGTNEPDNLAPVHRKGCHAGKTAREATDRAKADRCWAKHTGTAPPPTQKLKSRGFRRRWP